MAGDLQRAHINRSCESGEPFMGERYEQLMEAGRHPEEQMAKLRGEVDAARREFHASRRPATRSTTRARTCWLAHGCSPRLGAMPRTPCPA